MQPVIFLDMDGVLSTTKAWIANEHIEGFYERFIDQGCVAEFNRIVEAVDPLIVLSSTWRMDFQQITFRAFMSNMRIAGKLHRDWRTRRLNTRRGHEIAEWLKRHPEVTSFVVIDDDSDMNDDQPLIHTSTHIGLTAELADKTIQLLKGE